MCNSVKALRDEGKKRKKKILYTVNVYKKKEWYLYIVQLVFTVIFVLRRCLIIMNCKNMYEKNLSEFSNIYIHSLVSSFT